MNDVMRVDALVVDATYGSPKSIRPFTQGEAEDAFLAIVRRALRKGPVFVTAFRGTVERALDLVSGNVDCAIVCGEKLLHDVEVYRRYGYTIGHIQRYEEASDQGVLAENRYVRFFSTREQRPIGREGVTVIKLSAFGLPADSPVTKISDRSYIVGMSNHADFTGTLEFVKGTGAQFVVTDNTRGGRAVELAIEIRRRLGIQAWPSTNRLEITHGTEEHANWSLGT